MNVILDKDLLERARRASGERTYSATLAKGLEELLRRSRLTRALEELEELQKEGPLFDPEYVARMWPAESRLSAKTRVSADERRAPRKSKAKARGSR